MTFIKTLITEMANGNFSFAILITGIAQLFAMIRKRQNVAKETVIALISFWAGVLTMLILSAFCR